MDQKIFQKNFHINFLRSFCCAIPRCSPPCSAACSSSSSAPSSSKQSMPTSPPIHSIVPCCSASRRLAPLAGAMSVPATSGHRWWSKFYGFVVIQFESTCGSPIKNICFFYFEQFYTPN